LDFAAAVSGLQEVREWKAITRIYLVIAGKKYKVAMWICFLRFCQWGFNYTVEESDELGAASVELRAASYEL
jgi:hypothetical protein